MALLERGEVRSRGRGSADCVSCAETPDRTIRLARAKSLPPSRSGGRVTSYAAATTSSPEAANARTNR